MGSEAILSDLAENFYFSKCENPIVREYKNTREIQFVRLNDAPMRRGGKRGSIRGFSPASARRFRLAVNRYSQTFHHFVTVTFPPECVQTPDQWRFFCRLFWQYMGARCREKKIDYVWVREPHKDGRPHYHVLTNYGHHFARFANDFVGGFVTFPRKRVNRAVGIQVKRLKGKGGESRKGASAYMAKIASYVTKGTSGYGYHDDESYRHWARNFSDGDFDIYEASAGICDWLRERYYVFYPFKYPLCVSVPKDLPLGQKMIW